MKTALLVDGDDKILPLSMKPALFVDGPSQMSCLSTKARLSVDGSFKNRLSSMKTMCSVDGTLKFCEEGCVRCSRACKSWLSLREKFFQDCGF
jgi:hypothetical protein